MNKLRIILQFRYTCLIILIIFIIISFIRCNIDYKSKYSIDDKTIEGIITDKKIDGNKITLIVKGKEKIKCIYYVSTEQEKISFEDLPLGIEVVLKGDLYVPNNNTIPNTFNYIKYLYNNHIYYVMNVDNFSIINNDISFIFFVKNYLINRIKKYKSKEYLMMFILGDKSLLNDDVYNMYKSLSVTHIFAISGLHISLLSGIMLFFLKKVRRNIKYIIVLMFLILYLILVSYQASVFKSVVLFIILYLNKKFGLNMEVVDSLYLTISFILLFDPFYMFNIGFLYSSIITFCLIKYGYLIKGKYISRLIKISILSLLISLPITVNNNYEVNILSFINNLFFVPFISFVFYPLCLLSLVIPFLDNVLFYLIQIMEFIGSHLFVLNIIIPKMNIINIISYYLILHMYFNTYKKRYLFCLVMIIVIIKFSWFFDNNLYVYSFDVGQGDSSLIKYKNNVVLIDTGGKTSLKKEEWAKQKKYYISDNVVLFMKSLGITSINVLVISHGDYDHIGEAINLVNNFKVEDVVFNCGKYNDLENELLTVLVKKNINYYSCIKELSIDKYKLQFLNTGIYNNENDNSSVIYLNYNNYKFLFMGDASVTREKDIIKKYNLSNIDFLKVGHHGSNTSSSEEFIYSISPKYSLISVGKNNRYGHPKETVLDILENSKIYRTDIDGSIEIKINKKEYKISTFLS